MGTKINVSNYQTDYSSLLGSSSSSSSSGGINLADYASIKNGSYGKLMSAYYAKQKAETASSNSSVKHSSYKPSPVGLTDSSESLGKIESAVNALKKSTSSLAGESSVFNKVETTTTDENGVENTTSDYDTKAIYKAVSAFVDNYNAALDSTGGSVSAHIIERTNTLNKMTQGNKELLAKAGISVSANGRLTLDEKAMKEADIEDLKDTFNGVGSFGDQATSKIFLLDLAVGWEGRNISIASNYQNNTSSSSGTNSSTSVSTSSDLDKQLAKVEEDAENLKRMMDKMLKYGKDSVFEKEAVTTTDKNGIVSSKLDYDKEKIYDAVSDYVEYYNKMMESGAGSKAANITDKIGSLNSATQAIKSDLSAIGVTVGKDGLLSINEDDFMAANMDKVKGLFNGTGSYGYKVSSQASAIDSAAATEAAKSNTYSNNGSYSNNHSTGSIMDGYL